MALRVSTTLILSWLALASLGCNKPEPQPYTHINEAMRAGDDYIVHKMIRDGIDVNRREPGWELTPLLQAVSLDNLEVAEKLLDAGADIEAMAGDHTIEMIVVGAEEGSEAALDWLQQHPGIRTAEDFRASGMQQKYEGSSRMTALWAAASLGNREMVALLLKHHANVEVRAALGFTPLHVAALGGFPLILEHLIAAGANVEALCDLGYTPLTAASIGNQLETARTLLAAGADPLKCEETGRTAVEAAAEMGSTKLLELFAELGCDLSRPGYRKLTPLHYAAMRGRTDTVQFLLDRGAAVNAAADRNLTPLHIAATMGHLTIVMALVAAGADFTTLTDKGQTAQELAHGREHTDVAEFLEPLHVR